MSEVYHAHQLALFPTFEHTATECNCEGKRCARCEITQCIGQFHRHASSTDGYRSACKSCRKAERETEGAKEKRREHHKAHADQINEKKREWYHRDPERPRAYAQNYRENNPEKVKLAQQAANLSERGKQRHREYRNRHPEKVKQFAQAWRSANPEMEQEHAKVRAANYKAKQLGVPGKLTTRQWRELNARYNHTCLRCKQQEPAITLTIDHVIPFHFRGSNDISNIQPLCDFCNTSKGAKAIDYRISNEEKNCG